MKEKKEKFLPVGTVVMLEGGTKRIMVNGFCAIDPAEPKKMYDYSDYIEILTDSYEIYKGEKYHRIICIKEFKDIYFLKIK